MLLFGNPRQIREIKSEVYPLLHLSTNLFSPQIPTSVGQQSAARISQTGLGERVLVIDLVFPIRLVCVGLLVWYLSSISLRETRHGCIARIVPDLQPRVGPPKRHEIGKTVKGNSLD